MSVRCLGLVELISWFLCVLMSFFLLCFRKFLIRM